MKIAVWHNLNSGGAKRALFYHVEGLTRRGHEVTAFCPDTVDQSYLPLSLLIKENVLPLKGRVRNLYRSRFPRLRSYNLTLERLNLILEHCRECAALINRSNFDVLLASSSSDFYMAHIGRFVTIPKAMYLGEPCRPLYEAFPEFPWRAPERQMRRFASARNILNEILYWKKLFALGILAREELASAKSYDLILANSLFSRESIMRAYRVESKVCYLGIDTEKFRPANIGKKNVVVGVGSFGHLKGIDRAIISISKIPAQTRPELIWIGNLPDPEFIRSLTALAHDLNVRFTPKSDIGDQDLIRCLQKAAAVICLPFLEPFGLVPLEANACGTAVVGIAEGGLRETIINACNGYVVNDFNPDEIASKIELLTRNLSFAGEMGQRARKHVEEKWNYDSGISNVERYLINLVGRKATE